MSKYIMASVKNTDNTKRIFMGMRGDNGSNSFTSVQIERGESIPFSSIKKHLNDILKEKRCK